MQKIIVLLFILITVLTGCKKNTGDVSQNNGNTQPERQSAAEYQVYSQIPENWHKLKSFVAQIDREKVVYFTGEGVSSDIQAAKEMAILNAQAKAASAIKEITLKQLVVIKKNNPQAVSEDTYLVIEKRFSNNVNISGLTNAKNQYTESASGVTFTVLMAMDYAVFVKSRSEALQAMSKNQFLKNEKVTEIVNALKVLDERNNFFQGRQK